MCEQPDPFAAGTTYERRPSKRRRDRRFVFRLPGGRSRAPCGFLGLQIRSAKRRLPPKRRCCSPRRSDRRGMGDVPRQAFCTSCHALNATGYAHTRLRSQVYAEKPYSPGYLREVPWDFSDSLWAFLYHRCRSSTRWWVLTTCHAWAFGVFAEGEQHYRRCVRLLG